MGEFSKGVDTRLDEPMPRPPVGYLPYGDRKPYVLADTLTALNGPIRGVITLPRHLDWSGHAEYDLSRPASLSSKYKVVLTEAGSVDDLCTWLNGELLLRLWPTLSLPPQLRLPWVERFPELAATRTNAAARKFFCTLAELPSAGEAGKDRAEGPDGKAWKLQRRSVQESGRWMSCRNASSSRSGRTWRR